MKYIVRFVDGVTIDISLDEFEPDGIGAVIDHLAVKHGGVASIREEA